MVEVIKNAMAKKTILKYFLLSFIAITSLNAQVINLYPGWNLIGINEKPASADYWPLTNISDNSDITIVYGNGQTYIAGASRGNNLIGLEPSKGYWIKANIATTLNLSDGVTANTLNDISFVNTGWYLIGYQTTIEVSSFLTAFSSAGFSITIIYGNGETYIVGASRGNNLSLIQPGKGYWVKINTIEGIPSEYIPPAFPDLPGFPGVPL